MPVETQKGTLAFRWVSKHSGKSEILLPQQRPLVEERLKERHLRLSSIGRAAAQPHGEHEL